MITFHNVFKRYEASGDALRNVSFHIEGNQFVFLIGHSGAGKSTLLKLVSAIEKPTRGQVIVNNHNLNKLSNRRIPEFRRGLGIIFQDHKLLHDRSVFDNVALPLIVAGAPHQEIQKRVRAALDKVSLGHKEKVYPITLSGGEQQRVGIARAVVNRPALLLADEPTGNLDPDLSDEIMDLFAEFNHHGMAVLIATHDQRHIHRLEKPVLELEKGEMVWDDEDYEEAY
ncbi:MAG: cell division ATP-binding protein FtsE [Gammaproteobacteria bacterium]|nr:MAG: cell division ATP-binding protein FtsE [Gammaproteobacteria bacterium]